MEITFYFKSITLTKRSYGSKAFRWSLYGHTLILENNFTFIAKKIFVRLSSVNAKSDYFKASMSVIAKTLKLLTPRSISQVNEGIQILYELAAANA
jgi:hypothetical protein